MGETQRHHHVHHFDPEQLDTLLSAIRTVPAPPVIPDPDIHEPLDTWTFHDPRQQCDVTAYLDPQNQVRHVPITRAGDVPKTWRRIHLGQPG